MGFMRFRLFPGYQVLLLMVLLSGCAKDPSQVLLGTWQIDAKQSVDQAIATGVLPSSQRDTWIKQLEGLAETYQMTITEDLVATSKFEVPYTLSSGENGSLFLLTNFKGEEATLTYTPRNDGTAFFRSSATNDMDHWVWQKIR